MTSLLHWGPLTGWGWFPLHTQEWMNERGAGRGWGWGAGTLAGNRCDGVGQSSLREQWPFWGGASGLGVAQTSSTQVGRGPRQPGASSQLSLVAG